MSRLTINIRERQHQSLKALAARQGKTIKQYAIEHLFSTDAGGDRAWRELKTLLGQQIAERLAGGISTKSINTIIDAELGRDGHA